MIVAIVRIWNQIRTRADLNINKVSILTHLTLLVIFIVLNLTTVSFELSGVIIRLDNDEDKWLLDITLLELITYPKKLDHYIERFTSWLWQDPPPPFREIFK